MAECCANKTSMFGCFIFCFLSLLLIVQSLSDRGSSSRQVSRPSSLGSSASDIRDETASSAGGTSTSIHQHPVAAAAAAVPPAERAA